MKFPRSKKEFLHLLKKFGAADIEAWVRERKAFKANDVYEYLFLHEIWRCFENPNDSSFTNERMERKRARLERNPRYGDPTQFKIVEKMRAAGISPSDISTLILHAQFDLAHQFLYALDDPNIGKDAELSEAMKLGVYLEDDSDRPIKSSRWSCVHEMLRHARPSSYPKV